MDVSKEALVVTWQPVCHVPHGYRRVFVVSNHQHLVQYIVVLSFMGYENVYNVQQMVQSCEIQDPSLLWGLSVVKSLVDTEAIESEDGYISVRPRPLEEAELLPIAAFLKAAEDGRLTI